ncbi:MAG: NepR family anti-sigma factor [Alphaproteobacteria bacterium]|nr:NepR family anti-sigma factor [Alphaproteobacteria bacterium]
MAQEEAGDTGSKPVDAPTARRRQDAIGRRLRQLYDEVVSEPVPDDFLSFLQQADNRETPAAGPKGEGQISSPDDAQKLRR